MARWSCILAFVAISAAQTNEKPGLAPRFAAEVTLIRLEVAASESGQPVVDLKPQDILLTDNGADQPINRVSSTSVPLEIVLLIDVSGSMAKRGASIAAATNAVLASFQPGDSLCVMEFDTKARTVVPFSSNIGEIRKAILEHVVSREKRGGTRILAAVKEAADQLIPRPRSEAARVIVTVTDNIGLRTTRQSTVLRSVWEADATVAAIVARTAADTVITTSRKINTPYMALLEAGVDGVVRESGGEVLHLRGNGTIDGAAANLLERLRHRSLVFYRLPSDAKCGESRKLH